MFFDEIDGSKMVEMNKYSHGENNTPCANTRRAEVQWRQTITKSLNWIAEDAHFLGGRLLPCIQHLVVKQPHCNTSL